MCSQNNRTVQGIKTRVGWGWEGPGEKPCLPENQGGCLGEKDESQGWGTPSEGAWRGPLDLTWPWEMCGLPESYLEWPPSPTPTPSLWHWLPGSTLRDWGPGPALREGAERFPNLFLLTWGAEKENERDE